VEIQPKNLIDGIIEENGIYNFYGMMFIWSSNEIISVSISRDEASRFFEFNMFKTREKILEKIIEKVGILMHGNN